jgi:hypothetical protein
MLASPTWHGNRFSAAADPGSFEVSAQSGRSVVVAEMTLQQTAHGSILILGTGAVLLQGCT